MTIVLFLIGTILIQSIQMQLSKKPKSVFEVFCAFFEFRLKLGHFEKDDDLHSLYITETTDCERRR